MQRGLSILVRHTGVGLAMLYQVLDNIKMIVLTSLQQSGHSILAGSFDIGQTYLDQILHGIEMTIRTGKMQCRQPTVGSGLHDIDLSVLHQVLHNRQSVRTSVSHKIDPILFH